MPDHTRFIILANARTGSTMLASSLNSSPHIVCFREVFNRLLPAINYGVEGYDSKSAEDIAFRERDPLGYLNVRIYGGHPESVRAVGFKYLYHQAFAFEHVAKHLISHTEIRVVHLIRRNAIRSLASLKIMESGSPAVVERLVNPPREPFSVRAKRAMRDPVGAVTRLGKRMTLRTRRPAERKVQAVHSPTEIVHLSIDECRKAIWRQAWNEEQHDAKYADHPLIKVIYEDMVDDLDGVLARTQEFLDVEPQPLAPTTVRQHPQPLSELVENLYELREAFQPTPHAWMFEE